ncbi:MAG: hypothetical protein QM713_08070 [Arachnia sp.]
MTTSGTRRLGRIVVGVVVAVTVGAGLVLVGRWSVPLKERPGFAAPTVMPIVVNPQLGPLIDMVSMAGQVHYPTQVVVPLPPDDDAFRQVVTAAPLSVGDQVAEGDLIGAANERPVFVMKGTVPSFRVLREGDSGVDVRQLTKSLARLGYLYESRSTVTQGVLEAAYRFLVDRGYEGATDGLEENGLDTRMFAFVGTLPATVLSADVAVGMEMPEGTPATVTVGEGDPQLVVVAGDQGGVAPEGAAISATCGPVTVEGTLTDRKQPWRADPAAEGEGAEAPRLGLRVDTDGDLTEAVGASCAVTATSSVGDDDTVSVPASALFSGADGRTEVHIQKDGVAFSPLVVQPGTPVGGWVPLLDPPPALTASTPLLAGEG